MIKLSVIVPNYNKDKYIDKLLSQLKEQKTDEVEVIVVDDCSTDKSWEIIQKYSDVFTTVQNETNSWVSHTRNVGIDLAKGKYITFIDSDDEIKDIFISSILTDIRSNQDGYFYDYEVNNVLHSREVVEKEYNTMVWSKVYKRKVLNDNKIRFDEEYFKPHVLNEDNEFNARFLNVTTDIKVQQIEIIVYNWGVSHSVSNTNQIRNGIKEPFYEEFFRQHPDYMDKFLK